MGVVATGAAALGFGGVDGDGGTVVAAETSVGVACGRVVSLG